MEKYNFVGKNLEKPGRLENAKNIVENRFSTYPENQFEVNKDKRDEIYIQEARLLLSNKLESLGIEDTEVIPTERFHMVRKIFSGGHNFDSKYNIIFIDKSLYKQDGVRFFLYKLINKYLLDNAKVCDPIILKQFIHEPIHSKSHIKFKIGEKDGKEMVNTYRTGYLVNDFKNEQRYFEGLNEAIVEKIAQEILLNHNNIENKSYKNKIEKRILTKNSPYKTAIVVVEKIISEIAKNNKEPEQLVWERWEKGMFTGEMMHLRDIEKVFGPGSLRILASMNGREIEEKDPYHKYFFSKNEDEKKLATEEIVNSYRFKKDKNDYDNHLRKMENHT